MQNQNSSQNIIKYEIHSVLQKTAIHKIIDIPSKLGKHLTKRVTQKDIKLCRLLGIFGWSAYSIYDDIQDEEYRTKNIPLKLLAANYLNHQLYIVLRDLNLRKEHRELIFMILSKMLKTNIIDQTSTLSNKNIPWKSMGVAIPTLCLVSKAGASNSDLQKLLKFFYHFIYSRQISDDVRDLHEDRKNNKITAITTLYKKTKNFKSLSLTASKNIYYHAKLSLKFLRDIKCIKSTKELEKFPLFYINMSTAILNKLSSL